MTMPLSTQRRLLQICISLASLVPLSAGLAGMVVGSNLLGEITSISLDSHFRYLSGLLFTLGLGFITAVPRIESHTSRIRILTLLVVVGGIARLVAALAIGMPSTAMTAAIAMELIITPALCLWQSHIAKCYTSV
ncbi:MAG: DUF4345 domain-containing protein [Alphaproteobacteria bacterium]|nr:DUF4345 domain-containing protein [Alphaproteobacteria bacterium]